MKAREINSTIRYTMWSVFKNVGLLDDPPPEPYAQSTGLPEATTSSSAAGTTWPACGPTQT